MVADLPQAHRDAIEAAAIRPDGQLIATGGHDRAIRLWLPDGTHVMTLPAMGPVGMLAFSRNRKQLYVLVNGERAVRCWRLGQLAKLMKESGINPGY